MNMLIYLIAIVALLLAFPFFVFAFRRKGWWSVVTVVVMFFFGFAVYCQHGLTKPCPQVEKNWMAHKLAAADNTISSFFMSRGGYDDFGSVHHEAGDSGGCPPELQLVLYYFFHALCFEFSGAILCMMFGRRLLNAILVWMRIGFPRQFWKRRGSLFERQGPTAVFWDAGEESIAVADALNKKGDCKTRGRPIFAFLENKPFVLQRDPTSDEDKLDEPCRRFPWIYIHPKTLTGFCHRSLFHADEHYFLGPDGQKNVATANLLLERIPKSKRSFSPKIYIRIDADAEEDVLFKWADEKSNAKDSPEIVLIHEPSQVAASLLREYPLTDTPGISVKDSYLEKPDRDVANDEIAPTETEGLPAVGDTEAPLRVMIVGFGAQGKAILRETIQLGVFPRTRRSIDVTVVDADEKAFEPLWFGLKQVHGDIDNSDPSDPVFPARIIFKALDALSGVFWDFVNNRVPEKQKGQSAKDMPWNRIVFALPDDLANLRLAKRIERLYRNKDWLCGNPKDGESPVFFAGVRQNSNTKYAESFAKTASNKVSSWVATFGDMETLYKDLSSNLERQDKGAVYLNWTYNAERRKDGSLPPYSEADGLKSWREASFFNKESSRAAVSGIRTLARLLGWEVVNADSPNAVPADSIVDSVPPENSPRFDDLARVEHLRWCAFHILRGIRPWRPDVDCIARTIVDNEDEIKRFQPTNDKPKCVFSKPNDIKTHDRHAALVPTRELKAVDECFETGIEEAIKRLKGKGMADSDLVKIQKPDSVAVVDKLFVLRLGTVLLEACWGIKRVKEPKQ